MPGQVVYEAHPAMFRARPFSFVLCVLLILAFGLGILLLLYWYVLTRATQLTVTDHDITYERGILSKDRTSVALRQVRSVRVTQGFINRIFGVGTIEVSSTGDEPEFTVRDLPDPHEIRDAIRGAQRLEARGGVAEAEPGDS
ncbi:MAG TPA: PH domain-containing protein [Methyloceanibacter sp.]|nr:PH domain-containing protein [Methyloceanibacter sp.]